MVCGAAVVAGADGVAWGAVVVTASDPPDGRIAVSGVPLSVSPEQAAATSVAASNSVTMRRIRERYPPMGTSQPKPQDGCNMQPFGGSWRTLRDVGRRGGG